MVQRSGEETLLRLKELEAQLTNGDVVKDINIARSVFELSKDSVIIADESNKIRLLNEKAAEMFGYEPDEILNQKVSVLIPEGYREQHEIKQEEYFRNPYVRVFEHLEGLRKDGTRFPVSIALHPLLSHTGMLVMATLREVHGGGS